MRFSVFPRVLASLAVVLLWVSAPAAQEKSVSPGINKSYEKPDLKKSIERFESKDRDVVKSRDAILAACALRPGMDVADVGAGTGLFTRPFASKVAPGGKVFAVDINETFLRHIAATCQERKIANVTTVLGTEASANLPRQSVDLVFLCDTYHHFEFPQKMLASIFEALRPGGRVVLVEMHKRGSMAGHVRMDKKTAVAEFAEAGFTLIDERDLGTTQYLARFEKRSFRPPAVPLVVHDPYFSIWSFADGLAVDWPRHWTGTIHALASIARIDGKSFRLMGIEPRDCPAMKQVGLEVLPTRTIYDFEDAGVHVRLTFTSPLLPCDLELISRPVTYLTWDVWSVDGRDHEVSLYYDNTAELAVNEAKQAVRWSRPKVEGLVVMRMGSEEQPVLQKKGDNLRIDWGWVYVAVPAGEGVSTVVASHQSARQGFVAGRLPTQDDTAMPRPANQDWPVAAVRFDLGRVGAKAVARHLMLAYDDEYSIEYLGVKLRPYWRRSGAEAPELLAAAARQYGDLARRCEAFDRDLVTDLVRVGGRGYADLCALAYRQALGAHKLAAAPDGRPMYFPKENFSNGCIGTVDVLYPAAPIFALLNNDLLKATVTPVFDYAATDRWKFPFAPHDLGTYPKANGQVYGGGEKTEKNQMPVEESGKIGRASCRERV
jgi:ubiquinone/menaquinone biosynthesis C-methylase UbiE